MMAKAKADLLAGGAFVAFGLVFVIGSLAQLEVGTTFNMGPGYFPLALGVLLVVLGLLVVGEGLRAAEARPIGLIPWRAALLIGVALLFFGLTVRGLGLLPALFVAVLLAAFAAGRTSLKMVFGITVGLTALCLVIFVVALRLPLQLFGTWLLF